jgi:glycosyltransferase involved in cell wall biosynthesis
MGKIGMIDAMNRAMTVIIPTYNRAGFLAGALESVFAQTFRDFEIIVVDDGSQDETEKILSPFKKDIVYIRQENRGPASARNTGIRQAKSEWLAFLDSDDRWDKDKLLIQLREMKEKQSALISHTQEIWYRRGELLLQKQKHKKYDGYIFDKCLPLCAVGMSTVVAKKEFFDRVGLFDESFPCCEDYELWLRASSQYPFLLVDKPLTIKDGGRPDQVSFIYAKGMDKFRIQAIIKLLERETGLREAQKKLAVDELQKKCLIYGRGCIKHARPQEGEYYLQLPLKYF